MYIAIEGVIGVGKTTLARLLKPAFEAELMLEVFEENPFLSDFYADRERYAFQTQIFFLLSRYHQQREAAPKTRNHSGTLLSDYTFEKIPLPDLVVYLRATTDILMQRIALRDRPYERDMDRGYIDLLNHTYDQYYLDRKTVPGKSVPVLTIDTNDLNFVSKPDDLKQVEERIRQTLRLSPFQAELPLPMETES